MHSFKRHIYKQGIINNPLQSPPNYIGGGNYSTSSNSCTTSYTDFTYATAPLKRVLKLYSGTPAGSNLVGGYVGAPFSKLNVLNFTVKRISDNTSFPTAAKLYYLGTELTVFPLQIDMTGISNSDPTGLELGQQIVPLCVPGDGFRAELTLSIEDIYGATGANQIYTVQVKYQP